MKIEKAYIKSFGKLNDVSLDFSSGINIIRGANEAGKSTICNFIKFIFYGIPGRGNEKQKYLSWDTSSARGSLTVEQNGAFYRVERELICATGTDGSPVYREKAGVTGLRTNTVCFRGMNAGEAFFGVPEQVFSGTAFIGQLSGNKSGGRTLAESSENILFSASEEVNAQKALKRLDDARVYLMYKNRKGGKICELTSERDSLMAQLEEAKQASGDIIYLEGMSRQLTEKREKSKQRLVSVTEELEYYEKYSIKQLCFKLRAQNKEQKQTEEQIEKLKQAKEYNGVPVYEQGYEASLDDLLHKLDTASARYDAAKHLLDSADTKVRDMSEKIEIFNKLGSRGDRRDKIIEETRDYHKKATQYGVASIICAIAAVVFGIFGCIMMLTKTPSETAGIILSAFCPACAVAALVCVILKSPCMRHIRQRCAAFSCKTYEELDELVSAAMKDEAVLTVITENKENAVEVERTSYSELEAIRQRAVSKLEEAGFQYDDDIHDSILSAIEKAKEARDEYDRLKMTLDAQTEKVNETNEKLKEYGEDYIREALGTEFDDERMKEFNYKTKRSEYEFLQGSITALGEKLAQAEKELAVLLATTHRPDELSASIDKLNHEIDIMTERFNAYLLASDSIISASVKLREGVSPKIAKRAGELMSRLSMGKYSELGVDSNFSVTFSDGISAHPADDLSAGTSDIAYIAFRLALMDILFTKACPPLIFDESFSRMDDDRLTAMLTLIREYTGENGQTVIFTCHDREEETMAKIGDYCVIELKK